MSNVDQKTEAAVADQSVTHVGEISAVLTSKEMLEALIVDVHRERERVQGEDAIFVAA